MSEDQDLAKITLNCFHSIVYLSFLIKDGGLRDRLIAKAKPLLDRPGRSELERSKMLEQTVALLLDYLELLVYLNSAPLEDLLETQKQLLKLNLALVTKTKKVIHKKISEEEKVVEIEKSHDSILGDKIIEWLKVKGTSGLGDITEGLGGEYSKRTVIRYVNRLLEQNLVKKHPDTKVPKYTAIQSDKSDRQSDN